MEPIPCTPTPDCKYFNSDLGCHTSKHHIYRRAEADTPLRRRFCYLPSNTVQLCRAAHDELEATVGWPAYPDPIEMTAEVKGHE